MSHRITVRIDEALLARLRRLIPRRELNRFINQAIEDKIDEIERKQLEGAMKEGYRATRRDREELSRDWEVVDTEGWPA